MACWQRQNRCGVIYVAILYEAVGGAAASFACSLVAYCSHASGGAGKFWRWTCWSFERKSTYLHRAGSFGRGGVEGPAVGG